MLYQDYDPDGVWMDAYIHILYLKEINYLIKQYVSMLNQIC